MPRFRAALRRRSTTTYWPVLAVACAVAAAATPTVRAAARRWRFTDRPGPRSSHGLPTPRGGGVAILLGAAAGGWAAGLWTALDGTALRFVAGAALLAAMGLWDDRRPLSIPTKLAVQVGVAALLVSGTGGVERLPLPPPLDLALDGLAVPVAVLWIVGVTNAYNFLDGIDGLASLQAVVTGLGLGLAMEEGFGAALAVAVAGACLGFLPWNWHPASIFMGDVGSHTLGYTFASLPLLAAERRVEWVFVVAVSLGLFLTDAAWTRLARLARGGRWYAAHREHAYQRLVDAGVPQSAASLAIAAGGALLTACALLADSAPLMWATLLLAAALFAGEAWWVRRRSAAALT